MLRQSQRSVFRIWTSCAWHQLAWAQIAQPTSNHLKTMSIDVSVISLDICLLICKERRIPLRQGSNKIVRLKVQTFFEIVTNLYREGEYRTYAQTHAHTSKHNSNAKYYHHKNLNTFNPMTRTKYHTQENIMSPFATFCQSWRLLLFIPCFFARPSGRGWTSNDGLIQSKYDVRFSSLHWEKCSQTKAAENVLKHHSTRSVHLHTLLVQQVRHQFFRKSCSLIGHLELRNPDEEVGVRI